LKNIETDETDKLISLTAGAHFFVISWCIQHDYWTTALGVAAKGEVINDFAPQVTVIMQGKYSELKCSLLLCMLI
jgi:hypothetical protein